MSNVVSPGDHHQIASPVALPQEPAPPHQLQQHIQLQVIILFLLLTLIQSL